MKLKMMSIKKESKVEVLNFLINIFLRTSQKIKKIPAAQKPENSKSKFK